MRKNGAKAGDKLAYKSVFAPIFTSDVLNCYQEFTLSTTGERTHGAAVCTWKSRSGQDPLSL